MNESKEPIEQPSKTRAEIAAEDLERIRIENTKQKGDYKADFDQYLANKGEDESEESSIEQPGKTRAEIAAEDFAKIQIENRKTKADYKADFDQYLANEGKNETEDSSIKQEPSLNNTQDSKNQEKPEEVKTPEGDKKPEEVKTPEQLKDEEAKKAELEAKEEKEARIERAIENLKSLFDNKNKLRDKFQNQRRLRNKINIFRDKEKESKVEEEYRSVFKEYEKALEEVMSLTGKSEDQVIREYLSGKENNEESIENVNKNLDDAEGKLQKDIEGQSKEKKDVFERFTGIKDKRVKLLLMAAVASGAIALPVAGIAAGALYGIGLGQAIGIGTWLVYPNAMGLAIGNSIFASSGIGSGSVLLSKIMKEARDLKGEKTDSQKENKEVYPLEDSVKSEVEGIPSPEEISRIEKLIINRPAGEKMRPLEINGIFYDPENPPKLYQDEKGNKEYRGGKEINRDDAYSIMFWNKERSKGLKDAMKGILEDASKQGYFSITVGELKKDKDGNYELGQENKEKLAAYRVLAREMGYDIGTYEYKEKAWVVKATMTKINK